MCSIRTSFLVRDGMTRWDLLRSALLTNLSVTVPDGASGGSLIQVFSPDGKKSVPATVPAHLDVGDKFTINLEENNVQEAGTFSQVLNNLLSPAPEVMSEPVAVPQRRPASPVRTPSPAARPASPVARPSSPAVRSAASAARSDHKQHVQGERIDAEVSRVTAVSDKEQRDAGDDIAKSPSLLEALDSFFTPTTEKEEQEEVPQQKVMLVHVPPGVEPGETMQVEVPGENRTLAVVVPPHATSFHLTYTPKKAKAMPRSSRPQQAPGVFVSRPAPPSQKLLLVKVPPGTGEGATLHVSVPDEPGRILAAEVPPGNVKEFHVAYKPRTRPAMRGMLPPANAYYQAQNQTDFTPSHYQQGGYAPPPYPYGHPGYSNGGW